MKQYIANQISFNSYRYLITILDYETNLKSILKTLKLDYDGKYNKVLVDLALKVGNGKYRFVEYEILDNGTVDYMHGKYTKQVDIMDIKDVINKFLISERDIFQNSTLLASQKREIMTLVGQSH